LLGALRLTTDLRVTTAITCATVRIHPAVIVQAAATSAVMLEGRSPADLDRHTQAIQECADAGVDELYVQQIRAGHDGFFDAYAREILPRFA
jgi:hypothetical protein